MTLRDQALINIRNKLHKLTGSTNFIPVPYKAQCHAEFFLMQGAKRENMKPYVAQLRLLGIEVTGWD